METLIPPLSRRSQRPVHPQFGPPEPAIVSDIMTPPDDLQDPQESDVKEELEELKARVDALVSWRSEHELVHQIHQLSHSHHELEHQQEAS